jgi:hypothetical protein
MGVPADRKQTHLSYGLATGLVFSLVSFVEYHFHLDKIKALGLLAYLPFLVGILMNAVAYSKANNGAVTFGNVFGSCFKASMVVTLISLVWIIICMAIFPGMKDRYMEIAREQSANNRYATDESIETTLKIMDKYYVQMMLFFSLLYNVVSAFIFSLIGGGIAKKQQVGME